jgi:general secretion pathway protein J
MNARKRNADGFTLIEVLIAIAIFAILALISYRTLSSTFDTRERLQTQSSVLRDQALFFARIESDFNAVLPRAIRTADGLDQPALRLWTQTINTNEPRIAFTRSGFGATGDASAAPQRIGYRLKDGTIELLIWNGLDQAPRTEPTAYPALTNVRDFSWRALEIKPDASNWRDDWPTREQTDKSKYLPAAIELTVTPKDGAPIVRIFPLRESADES